MSNRHFQKHSNEIVIAALAALANAPTWEMTYEVLKTNAEILTSDRAFAYLCEIISIHRSLKEFADVDNWNAYLGLLEDIRKQGDDENRIETAWGTFLALQDDAEEAIEFFLGATKEEKRKFLVSDTNLLLSNPAFVYLRHRIAGAQVDSDVELVELLEPHLHLLEEARAFNINAAWTHWEKYM